VVDVSKYIERAEQEVRRKNYDHAITLYREILQIDPDCGEARAGTRMAAIKKLEKRYPSAIERAVLNFGPNLCLPFAKLFRSHAWTSSLCEQALRRDPKNVGLNHRLGHSLLALGHKKSAEAAFRVVTEVDQTDIESLKILGRLLAERKDHEAAISCFERALKLNPRDQEAGKMRKDLAAEGAIRKGGFEQAKSSRDLAKSDRQLHEAERAQRIVRTQDDIGSAIDDLDAEIAKAPSDARLLGKKARLLADRNDFPGALSAVAKALELSPEIVDLQDLKGDLELRKIEAEIVEADREAKAGEDGADDRLRRLRRTLASKELEELRRRVRNNPTDPMYRFKLGKALLTEGETAEATEHLQAAIKEPKLRIGAQQLLGRAFASQGLPDLAIKQFTEAISKLAGMNDQKKELLYELAQLHEKKGGKDAALDVYQQIYESDVAYKDVGDRIKALAR
jgi:tetratricopeptide (TPR) repeat protein